MKSRINTRAISPVVGMVLVLAIIAGIMSIIQTQYVPRWDYQKEVQSYNALLSEVREIPALLTSSQSSTAVKLDAGTDYPQYPFLVNIKSSYGVVEIFPENVSVSYTVFGKKVDENYTSSTIIVRPYYLYMPQVNITYEHGAVIMNGSNYARPIVLSQVAFSKDSISLPIVESSNFSAAAKTFVLHFYLVSKGEGKEVSNLTVAFQTRYPELWEDILKKIYGNNVSVSGSLVTLHVSGPVTLSISAWNTYAQPVGTPSSSRRFVSAVIAVPEKVYLNPGQRSEINVQLLDRYGNPITNASINVKVDNASVCKILTNSSLSNKGTFTTSIDGVANFFVEALNAGKTEIEVTTPIPSANGGKNTTVVEVNVTKLQESPESYYVGIVHANATWVGDYYVKVKGCGCGGCKCGCWKYDVYTYNILVKVSLNGNPQNSTPVDFRFLDNSGDVIFEDIAFTNSTGYAKLVKIVGVYAGEDSCAVNTMPPPQKFLDEKPFRVIVTAGVTMNSTEINYMS